MRNYGPKVSQTNSPSKLFFIDLMILKDEYRGSYQGSRQTKTNDVSTYDLSSISLASCQFNPILSCHSEMLQIQMVFYCEVLLPI
jgi:hypothetical protein